MRLNEFILTAFVATLALMTPLGVAGDDSADEALGGE
jgi:hypothetical protein